MTTSSDRNRRETTVKLLMLVTLMMTSAKTCSAIPVAGGASSSRSSSSTSSSSSSGSSSLPATQMSPRVVQTQYGKLRGVIVIRNTATSIGGWVAPSSSTAGSGRLRPVRVEQFLGLQYASTMGSELRFMPPTGSMEKWEGIHVALKHRPVCPQPVPDLERLARRMPRGRVDHFRRLAPFVEKQTEDCLSLNVYVPLPDPNATRTLHPVVVFVHGETYETGTGNAYDGSGLAAYGSVVVVTVNYRLGVLGFLSTGDSNAPGNYALLDLVAALHWIKENIEPFGGDPSCVTLMGHGHGAALVNLLIVSPVTRDSGLFRRAIIQSGTALASWSLATDALLHTVRLARTTNCSVASSANAPVLDRQTTPAILRCLKRLPVDRLINFASSSLEDAAPRYLTSFGPTVDGRSVLPTDVRRLTGESSDQTIFGNVDVLLGFMKNEGFTYFNQTDVDMGVSADRLHRVIRTFVRNVYAYHRQYIYDVLLYQYQQDSVTGPTARGSLDPAAVRDLLMELIGDAEQVAPSIDLARRHAAAVAGLSGQANTGSRYSRLDDDDWDEDTADDSYYDSSLPIRRGTVFKHIVAHASTTTTTSSTTTSSPSSTSADYDAGHQQSRRHGTYLYCFGYPTRFDVYPRWADGVHGDDLAYVFGAPLAGLGAVTAGGAVPVGWTGAGGTSIDPFPSIYTRADRSLSELVMRYWTGFIRTGNPNSDVAQSAEEDNGEPAPYWPRYELDKENYMHIGPKTSIRHKYRAETMAFWLDLIPKLHRPDTNIGSRYHQLDDPLNSTSFEEDGTLHVEYPDVKEDNYENDGKKTSSAFGTVASSGKAMTSSVVAIFDVPAATTTTTLTNTISSSSLPTSSTSFPLSLPSGLSSAIEDWKKSTPTTAEEHVAEDDWIATTYVGHVTLEFDASGGDRRTTLLPSGSFALVGTALFGFFVLIVNCIVFAAVCGRRRSRVKKRHDAPVCNGQDAPVTAAPRTAFRSTSTLSKSSCDSGFNRRGNSTPSASSQPGYRVHFVGVAPSSPTCERHPGNGRLQHHPYDVGDDYSGVSGERMPVRNADHYTNDPLPMKRPQRNGGSSGGGAVSIPSRYASALSPLAGLSGNDFGRNSPPEDHLESLPPPPDRAWSAYGYQAGVVVGAATGMARPASPVGQHHAVATLPPPCIVGPSSGTIRRTPYLPRYTSDGQLKHFPVGRKATSPCSFSTGSTAADGTESRLSSADTADTAIDDPVNRVDSSIADGNAAGSNHCQHAHNHLLQHQHHHQQLHQHQHHHHHHHILPIGCESPEVLSTLRPNNASSAHSSIQSDAEK